MSYALVGIAAAIFGVVLTRADMLILTAICPGFFKRLDWIFMMEGSLQEGLWGYGVTLVADEQDEREVEGEVFVPLTIGVFLCALVVGELVCLLTHIGILGAIVVTLIASQIPLLLGLALIGGGAVLLARGEGSGDASEIDADEFAPLQFNWAERLMLDLEDRWEAFKRNPLALIDRLYARAFGRGAAEPEIPTAAVIDTELRALTRRLLARTAAGQFEGESALKGAEKEPELDEAMRDYLAFLAETEEESRARLAADLVEDARVRLNEGAIEPGEDQISRLLRLTEAELARLPVLRGGSRAA
jgi:hypothetical protein